MPKTLTKKPSLMNKRKVIFRQDNQRPNADKETQDKFKEDRNLYSNQHTLLTLLHNSCFRG